MYYRVVILVSALILTLTGCSPSGEVSIKPNIPIPVSVSINTNGEVSVKVSYELRTPIATIELSGGGSQEIFLFRQTEPYKEKRLLLIRVDNELVSYELKEGQEFEVNFENHEGYRKVNLKRETDGDIILELESNNSGKSGLSEVPQEQQVTPPTPTPVQLVPDFQAISLKSLSELSEPETNLGLGPGINQLAGIPFENGWKSTTQCSYISDRPTRFEINNQISNPVSVYLLLQAGWGIQKYKGQQIGVVSLLFSNGNLETVLTLGKNIRDWSVNSPDAVSTVSSPTIQEAWRGNAPNGESGRMDMLTIDIPSEYRQSILKGIMIEDTTTTTTGNFDPCIHLLAITVKYMR